MSVLTFCFEINLGLGILLLVTFMPVVLGCSNMKGYIFDKWYWSASIESCTLAYVDLFCDLERNNVTLMGKRI